MKVALAVVIMILVATGAWFLYDTYLNHTPIGDILSDPRAYHDRVLVIEGQVKERISFFAIKSFVLKDDTGEIHVVTSGMMPEVGTRVRVRGSVQEAFSLGNFQMLVFKEESGD